MATRNIRNYIEAPATKFAESKSALAKSLAGAMKRALATYDELPTLRAPIVEQAGAEMRNEAWRDGELNKVFGGKLGEVARLDREVKIARRAHEGSKPTLAPLDTGNLLAVMETVTLAQQVATKGANARLTPQEKLAAIRSPALSQVSPEMVGFWMDEIIKTTQPDRVAAYQEDASALDEAELAVTEVKRALQRETGHLNPETGLPNASWDLFARAHLAPLAEELRIEDEAAVTEKRDAGLAEHNTATETELAKKYRLEREAFRNLLR
jgi:hypothetical protein